MTDKLFAQISDRIDTIQSKIEFLNEVEMRIDSILSNLIEELEDEEDEEDEDDEEVVEEKDILSELESVLTDNTTDYPG
jgi:molybdopterin converting factor small subunit